MASLDFRPEMPRVADAGTNFSWQLHGSAAGHSPTVIAALDRIRQRP
jgi:hypothetical protein